MNITLTKPLEDFVQTQVNKGIYTTANDVIKAGLKALAEQQEKQKLEQKINTGLAQAKAGLGEDFNNQFADKLIKKVQQRIALNQNS